MTGTPVKFKGRIFPSIKAAAKHCGVSPSTVSRLMKSGMTAAKALTVKTSRRMGRGKAITIEGRDYRTIKDACIAYGVDADTIRARIRNGYTPEDAIFGNMKDKPLHPMARSFTYKGKTYSTGKELAAEYGQRYSNVIRRVNRGWTLSQALLDAEPPPRFRNFEGHARNINWKNVRETPDGLIEPIPDADGYKVYLVRNRKNGKEYVGITTGSLAARLSQHFATSRKGRKAPLYNAIRKYGTNHFEISLIRADAVSYVELQMQEVEEIARRKTVKSGYNVALGGSLGTSKMISIDGKTFPSQAAAADYYGIDQGVFNLRLNRLKWSPEEAAGLVDKDWAGKAQVVTIAGREFESVRKAAEFYKKDYKKVYDRYGQKGWSLEQALDLEPMPTNKGQSIQLVYKRRKYASLAEFARTHKLNPDLVSRKMREGMTLTDVMRWLNSNTRARKRK
jgi:hypothetical protein